LPLKVRSFGVRVKGDPITCGETSPILLFRYNPKTPHVGVALSQSPLWLDNDTVVFASNVDREMLALARVDKLADGRLLLNWNAAGRSELAYFDPASGELAPGPMLPAEIAGGPLASIDGQQVVVNLRERGVPVKYVLFPDEGHGWGKVENRVTSDVGIVRWFEEHL